MPRPAKVPGLSIGALSRRTGVPIATLRTWERRYGAPRSTRRPSGHRLFALEAVPFLERALAAIRAGHRPGDVLALNEAQIERLLGTRSSAASALKAAPGAPRARTPRALIAALLRWDLAALQAGLESAAAHDAPRVFLERTAVPFLRAVGDAWQAGRLEIRHEHAASAQLGDVLRALHRRLEPSAPVGRAALASLPGDAHELGLHMAAVLLAAAGWRTVRLGAETPVAQLRALARERAVELLVISVSATAPRRIVARDLPALARECPADVPCLVGGAGAPERLAGVTILPDLGALAAWLARHGRREAAPQASRRRAKPR